jgi:hypothetical protein
MPTKVSFLLSLLIVKLKHLPRLVLHKEDIFTPVFPGEANTFLA